MDSLEDVNNLWLCGHCEADHMLRCHETWVQRTNDWELETQIHISLHKGDRMHESLWESDLSSSHPLAILFSLSLSFQEKNNH